MSPRSRSTCPVHSAEQSSWIWPDRSARSRKTSFPCPRRPAPGRRDGASRRPPPRERAPPLPRARRRRRRGRGSVSAGSSGRESSARSRRQRGRTRWRSDGSATIRMSTPWERTHEPHDERALQHLLAPPAVGRADEDVGRPSVGGDGAHRLDEVVRLLLEEVRAEHDAEPPQSGELRRARRPTGADPDGAPRARRARRSAAGPSARRAAAAAASAPAA